MVLGECGKNCTKQSYRKQHANLLILVISLDNTLSTQSDVHKVRKAYTLSTQSLYTKYAKWRNKTVKTKLVQQ